MTCIQPLGRIMLMMLLLPTRFITIAGASITPQ